MDTEEKKITESGTDNLLDTVLLGMSSIDSKKEISELGKVVKDRLENLINLDKLLCNGVEDMCCVVIHISKLFKEKGKEELGKKFVEMQKNFIDTIIEQLKTLKLICEEKYFDEEKYIGEYLSQLNVICRQLGLYKKLIPIVDDKPKFEKKFKEINQSFDREINNLNEIYEECLKKIDSLTSKETTISKIDISSIIRSIWDWKYKLFFVGKLCYNLTFTYDYDTFGFNYITLFKVLAAFCITLAGDTNMASNLLMTFIKYTRLIIYNILNFMTANLISIVADLNIIKKLQAILDSITYILILYNSQIIKNFFHFCCKMMSTFQVNILSSSEYISEFYNEIVVLSTQIKDSIVNGVINIADFIKTLSDKTFESIKYVFSSLFSIGNDIFKSMIKNPYNKLSGYYDYLFGKGISSELVVQSQIPLSTDQVLAIINDPNPTNVGSLLVKYGKDRIKIDPTVLKQAVSEIFEGENSAIKLAQLLNIINIDEETIRYSSGLVLSKLETKALNGLNVFIENLKEKNSNLFNEYIKQYGLESLFILLEKYSDEKDLIQRMNKLLLISESDICNKKVLILLGILFFIMYIFSIKIFSFNNLITNL
jgi:hypothetical protein